MMDLLHSTITNFDNNNKLNYEYKSLLCIVKFNYEVNKIKHEIQHLSWPLKAKGPTELNVLLLLLYLEYYDSPYDLFK